MVALALGGGGCRDEGSASAPSPEQSVVGSRVSPSPVADVKDGCSKESPLESDGYFTVVPEYVWDPLVYGLLFRAEACGGPRFELYDLRTRSLIARRPLPPIPHPDGRQLKWGFQGLEYGHAWFHAQASHDQENNVILIRLRDGSEVLDSRRLRADAHEAYGARFFTHMASSVRPTAEVIYIDLKDGERVAFDPTSGSLTPTDDELPRRQDIAKRHGCDQGYRNQKDQFNSTDNNSRYAGGTTGVTELRPEKIFFVEKDGKVTLTIYDRVGPYLRPDEDSTVLMATKDAFFQPRIFVPAECVPAGVDRRLPAPLLVAHQSSLDRFRARSMLSRIAPDGATRWTIDLPCPLDYNTKVRFFGSTLFVFHKHEKLGLWIDLEAGTLTTVQFTG